MTNLPEQPHDVLQMKVTGLTIDPFTNMPIIILKDLEGKTALPIWIGLIEASAIATELEKIQLARPMTHDLVRTLLEKLNVRAQKVEIHDLSDNTFYADIYLEKDGQFLTLDCRPSDAIALALRLDAPIYVHRKVLEKSREVDLSKAQNGSSDSKQKWNEILENLAPEDFGKYKM